MDAGAWFFAVNLLGACATGFAAQCRGRDSGGWFLAGLVLWIVALPWVLLLPKREY
jgi:hypothetical protein